MEPMKYLEQNKNSPDVSPSFGWLYNGVTVGDDISRHNYILSLFSSVAIN